MSELRVRSLAAIAWAAIGWAAPGRAADPAIRPTIENERIIATDVNGVQPSARHDFVSVSLTHPGAAAFGHQGEPPGSAGERSVVIELKDRTVEPLVNPTSYPLAFPRAGAKKLLENERVVVWRYAWHAGQPTPMHFHDKDAIVVFEGDGAIESTTSAGERKVNTVKFGDISFNPRGRIHTEILASGDVRAVITELK